MIRMTKQTDYGFVLLSRLAAGPAAVLAAPELAEETRLPLPMVSKILKLLVRHGLLDSHRGVKGGYSLARPASDITAAEILRALEGPVALTVCIEGSPGECDREPYCEVRRHWQAINEAVDGALGRITLDDLARPAAAGLVRIGAGRPPRAANDAGMATT
ncbi:MAG: SUF system Fe-S cluster assembly regulator [Thermoanaerobaculia bacterium]|nr:MAG: SUF system Fe-S cluster assembly regulator [Thermoanaerobaculia bacterium]